MNTSVSLLNICTLLIWKYIDKYSSVTLDILSGKIKDTKMVGVCLTKEFLLRKYQSKSQTL